MRHIPLAALIAGATLVAACQKKAPEAEAPEVSAATAEAANMPAPEGAVGADLPTDATTPEQQAAIDAAAAEAGLPPTPQRRVSFSCADGEAIEVRFFPEQGIAVLVRDGKTTELNGDRVASGYSYTGGEINIRGKGEELTLTVGAEGPVDCTPVRG